MKEQEVLEKLCYNDPRNPDCSESAHENPEYYAKMRKAGDCYCDNCFYGRTELAEEILRLLPLIK